MDEKLKNFINRDDCYFIHCLTKEERRAETIKLAKARDKMIDDITKHNERILKQKEEPKYIGGEEFFFFDLAHPFASLLANWWGIWR